MLLLGLIGVLALALPLSQVLRFQVEALTADRTERSRLDPLTEAVALHRGLAGHDEVATLVLQGRGALEAERLLRKAAVDRDLAQLRTTLWAGDWPQARHEATGLHADWRELADGIAQRSLAVPESRQRHRLLQEQVVQVMDLVVATLPAGTTRQALAALPPPQWLPLLQARRDELDRRIARHEATRLAAAALAGALLLATLILGALLRRGPERPGGAAAAASKGLRRSHGRRAGDRPPIDPPSTITAERLQALRRSAEDEPSRG